MPDPAGIRALRVSLADGLLAALRAEMLSALAPAWASGSASDIDTRRVERRSNDSASLAAGPSTSHRSSDGSGRASWLCPVRVSSPR